MSRRAWTVFVVVQLVGAICAWEGPRNLTALGPMLFLTGLVLLAPGWLPSLLFVEKLFWTGGLTLSEMTWVELALTLVLNAALWWLVARAISVFRGRESG